MLYELKTDDKIMSDSILFSRYFPYEMTTLHIFIRFLLFLLYYVFQFGFGGLVRFHAAHRISFQLFFSHTYSCSILVFRFCFCPMLFSESVIWYFGRIDNDWTKQWTHTEHTNIIDDGNFVVFIYNSYKMFVQWMFVCCMYRITIKILE